MTMKSVFAMIVIVTSASLLGACETKKAEVKKPLMKQEVVVKLTLESLDRRVTVLEEARVRQNAKVKKFSPAPKYDPNFK